MMFNKILSLLLAVAITVSVFTVLPASISAEEINSSSQTGQVVFVTGEGSVGGLLSKAINESQDKEGDCENCITDVSVDGRTATVAFSNAVLCMIVVGLYDESGDKLLMTAVQRDIAPDTGHISLSFDCDPPENFYLRAFILDENCAPLHKQYETEHYTSDFQDFLEKDTGDFPSEDVLNFDGNPTNNFAVLSEDVERIDSSEHNILSAQNSDRYTFTDINDSLRNLKSGDILCFDRDGETEIIRAESVTVSGDTAVVTSNDNLTMEDAFSYVKIDTSLISGTPEMDMSGADGGIMLDDSGPAPTGSSYDIGEKEEYSFRFTIDGGETASASGGLTISAGYHVHLYYTKDIFETSLSVETETKIDVTLTNEFKGEKQLGRAILPTPVAGLAVGIGFSLILEASAQITSQVTLSSMVGFSYNKNTGFDLISEKPSVNAEVAVEGTFFVGIGITPSVYVLYGAVSLGLPVRVGAEIIAKSVVTTTDSEESAHKCHSCIDGTVSVVCTVSGEVDVLLMWDKKIDFGEIRWELFEYYYSSDVGWGLGKCPNRGIPAADKDDMLFEPDLGDLSDIGSCTIEWDGGSVMTLRGRGRLNEEAVRNAADQYEDQLCNTYGVTEVYNSDTHETIHYYHPIINPRKRLQVDLFANLWRIQTLNIIGFTAIDNSCFKGYYRGVFDVSYYVKDMDEENAFSHEIDRLRDELDSSAYEGLFNVTQLNISGPTVFIDKSTFAQGTDSPGYYRNFFENLTDINLSDSILWIGDGAFGASMITECTLPASLGYLGVFAFKHIDKLTVPAGVEHLSADRSLSGGCNELKILTNGEVRFSKCNVKELILNNHAKRISDYFLTEATLSELVIPSSVEEIGDHAFEHCNFMTTVTLPQSLKKLGAFAFSECTALKYINIPASITEIEYGTFEMCTSLEHITIPGNVAAIGSNAFGFCESLTDLNIEEGVKSIGENTFLGCQNLRTVVLPRSLTELHSNAFFSTIYYEDYSFFGPHLESITYKGTLREWNSFIAGYDYIGEATWFSDDYYKAFLRENYGEEYAEDAKMLEKVRYNPWEYMPDRYKAYTMGERTFDFSWNSFPIYCTGGKNNDEIAPTGSGLAANGSQPGDFYPNTEFLIAVEDSENGRLNGAIKYLTQASSTENGELFYALSDGLLCEGDHVNIYGACSHPSAHFADGGYSGKQIYKCDICGEVIPAVIDLSYNADVSEPSKHIIGDVDGDGEVTLIDASLIQRWLVNLSMNANFDEESADVDHNGDIEVTDATWIQRYVAEMEIPYQVGETVAY